MFWSIFLSLTIHNSRTHIAARSSQDISIDNQLFVFSIDVSLLFSFKSSIFIAMSKLPRLLNYVGKWESGWIPSTVNFLTKKWTSRTDVRCFKVFFGCRKPPGCWNLKFSKTDCKHYSTTYYMPIPFGSILLFVLKLKLKNCW